MTNGVQAQGLQAEAYDKSYDDIFNDLTTSAGFGVALALVLRIAKHGVLWAAPVCRSWSWMCRSGSKRTELMPGGNSSSTANVEQGNRQARNLTLLFLVAWVRNVNLFLEQPLTSVMKYYTPMKEFLECCMPYSAVSYMQSWGGETSKPLKIWSTTHHVQQLRTLP